LAFPQNPCHRLIKDYKLVKDSLNSPLADCRLSLELFNDQHEAFSTLAENNSDVFACYQTLLAGDKNSPLWSFFFTLSRKLPKTIAEIKPLIRQWLKDTESDNKNALKVCQTRLQQ